MDLKIAVYSAIRERYDQKHKPVRISRISKQLKIDYDNALWICKKLAVEKKIEILNNCLDRTVPKNEFVIPII